MFDFDELLKNSISKFRIEEQKSNLPVNPNNRLKKAYINLDISLSKLASDSKRFSILNFTKLDVSPDDYKKNILEDFSKSMNLFLLVANLKNWNHLIHISNDEQNRIFSNKSDSDFSNVYIVIKKMLFNSLSSHNEKDFLYAWKIFNKFGIVDLNLKINDVIEEVKRINKNI
ncbi:hypothetical protein MOO46_01580 [Apilactobacillus apisilvae]|uniref:dUTPase n=1 Tax=Apilactobacillus apisilvae TaxID=2923364 RepID=A0ABY4PHI8_9LACO|nr:hypothetical protein [Apilactobacillus apisilvae]UQS85308.1 hypothetical protein MOO46_01580 [Apilactobacillus apisilvae]